MEHGQDLATQSITTQSGELIAAFVFTVIFTLKILFPLC